jgi:hypothetical protein
VLLIGEAAEAMAAIALRSAPIEVVGDLDTAIDRAARVPSPGSGAAVTGLRQL